MSLVYYLNEVLGIKSIPRHLMESPLNSSEDSGVNHDLLHKWIEYKTLDLKQIKSFQDISSAQFHMVDGLPRESRPGSPSIYFIHASLGAASLYKPEVFELFLKMAKAMGLQFQDFCVFEFDSHHQHDFFQNLVELENQIVIYFNSSPERQGLKKINSLQWLETYSPAQVLENPELKKAVWDDLQLVMKARK